MGQALQRAAPVELHDRTPIVALTKMAPGHNRQETVYRQRLVDRITQARVPLVSITGPAGTGKSTLMAQCFAAESPAAWLSIDASDNDAVVLWWSLIESIGQVSHGFGDNARRRLATEGRAVLDETVDEVCRELSEHDPVVHLFLDNVHLLTDEQCARYLQKLILSPHGSVRVVTASRGELPFPVAHLRHEGSLLELNEEDLFLSLAESTELLASHELMNPPSAATVAELFDRTEGWAAGLQLAAMMVGDAADQREAAYEFRGTDHHVADYLSSEVLLTLSEDDRRFMIETSVLDTLSADLCNAVTGRRDSAAVLDRLKRSNGFVVGLDDEAAGLFRYHRLLGELLESKVPEVQRTDLHRRAFAWLRENGSVAEAVSHGVAAGLVAESGDLISEHWFELVNTGQIETMEHLIGRFDPGEIVSHVPLTIAAAAVAGLSGDQRRARRLLAAAEENAEGQPSPDGAISVDSSLLLVRSGLALDGVESALADARRAYALEPPGSPWRPFAALVVGLALSMKGEASESIPFLTEASQAPEDPVRAFALAELAVHKLRAGDAETAQSLANAACEIVEAACIEDRVVSASAYAARALTQISLGNNDDASGALAAAAQPVAFIEHANPMESLHATMLLAEAAIQLGNPDASRAYMNRATKIAVAFDDTGAMSRKLGALRTKWRKFDADTGPEVQANRPFTERELQVLTLLPSGLSIREIGQELFLSRNTAKTYIRRIYKKLGVSSRAEAIQTARTLNYL